MSHNYEKIYTVVKLIPAGKVATYGQVADLAGLPRRARMVSKALKESTESLPWHRILAASGKISLPVGSEGYLEQVQRLRSENIEIRNGRLSLQDYQWQPDPVELLFRLDF